MLKKGVRAHKLFQKGVCAHKLDQEGDKRLAAWICETEKTKKAEKTNRKKYLVRQKVFNI